MQPFWKQHKAFNQVTKQLCKIRVFLVRCTINIRSTQVRNQLRTPGGAKSFPRGA